MINIPNKLRGFYLSTGLFLFLTNLSAYAGSITAELSSSQVQEGQPVKLEITISGNLDESVYFPDIPGIENAGQSSSSNIQIINGRVSRERVFSYTLIPEGKGTYKIPAIEAKIDGKVERTAELTLVVKEVKALTKDEFKNSTPPIFIERTIAKKDVYVGEPVLASVSIYRRVKIIDSKDISKSSPDTIVIRLEGGNEERQEINGTPYRVTTFNRYLVPIKPGTLEIPPFELYTIVPDTRYRANRDPFFGMFGGPRGQEKRVRSDKTTLNVSPVPSENRPANFRELVGVYEGNVNLDKTKINMGETVTATIQIAGNGRLETLREIKLDLGDGAKIYPDKPEIQTNPTPDLYSARGTYRIAIVPTRPGTLVLGKIEIPFFNPESAVFDKISLELGTITVEGNPDSIISSGTSTLTANKKQIKTLTADIIDIKRTYTASNQLTTFDFGIFALFLILPSGFLGFAFIRTLTGSSEDDAKRRQASKAFKTFKKNLQSFDKETEESALIRTLMFACKTYFADKFHMKAEAITISDVWERVEGIKEIAKEEFSSVRNVFKWAEAIEYGGGTKIDSGSIKENRDQILNLIKKIEGSKK